MDKIKGVTIPKDSSFGNLFALWMFGTPKEKEMVIQNIWTKKKCTLEEYQLEQCLKECNKCSYFMEELKKCKKFYEK